MGNPIDGPDDGDGHWVTINGTHVFIPAPGAAKEGVKGGSKSSRARDSQKKMTKEKLAVAMKVQEIIAQAVGGAVIPDNKAYDVVVGKEVLEIKTLIHATNDKITIHPESKERKLLFGTSKNRWVVVVDARTTTPHYYLFNAVGSFRLGNKHQEIPLWQIKHVFGS